MCPEGAVEAIATGERLWLLPERAAYWPRRETLLVADAHLGKAAAFRKAGIAVPSGTTAENLERLTSLVTRLRAKRIVFLGDLVHNRDARDAASAAFERWRARHAQLEVVLVRGNHDRSAGDPPCEWNVTCVAEPYAAEGLALCHAPQVVAGAYAIAGHVHPAAVLGGRGREHVRLPCFHFTPDCAILPAYGAFTGMADVTAGADDRIYVIADDEVIALDSGPLRVRGDPE